MIHSEIKQALLTLNVPVAFQLYEGSEQTFLTYFQYDERPSLFTNDQEAKTEHYFQINVFSKSDYAELIKGVKEQMLALGGIRLSEFDTVTETEFYQRSMRFKFIQ